MTERRETGRGKKHPPQRRSRHRKPTKPHSEQSDWSKGERIAKYLARAGIASRREVERLIEAGEVSVNGQRLSSPAFKVTGEEHIKVGRKTVTAPEPTRLWRYHKPAGLISTTHDPEGRRTIFEELPKSLPRVVTVGRLDLNTEGLLLLTNDGALARALELPKTELIRTYRVRAHGTLTEEKIAVLAAGITVDGMNYAPITAELDRETGANCWLTVSLAEGKKREVRRALEALDLQVNRLIRIAYGPFQLSDLTPGAVEEVAVREMLEAVGEHIAHGDQPKARTAPKSRLHRTRRSGRVKTGKKTLGS